MHLKREFITQTIDDKQMMVAIGESAKHFHGIVKSNSTAAFIVNQMKRETTEDEIVSAMLAEYEVDEATARRGVETVIEKLQSIGALE